MTLNSVLSLLVKITNDFVNVLIGNGLNMNMLTESLVVNELTHS